MSSASVEPRAVQPPAAYRLMLTGPVPAFLAAALLSSARSRTTVMRGWMTGERGETPERAGDESENLERRRKEGVDRGDRLRKDGASSVSVGDPPSDSRKDSTSSLSTSEDVGVDGAEARPLAALSCAHVEDQA